MNEVEEAAVLETELDALGASPTARQIMDVIAGFSDNAINIALKRTSGSGGGGGIQFGPEVNEGDQLSILTNADNLNLESSAGDVALTATAHVTVVAEELQAVADIVAFQSGDTIFGAEAGDFNVNAEDDVNVTAADQLTLSAIAGDVALEAGGGHVAVTAAQSVVLNGATIGFFGNFPGVSQPVIPAIPTAQDVVDALVALGLVSQAP